MADDNDFDFDLQPVANDKKRAEHGWDWASIMTIVACLIVAGLISLLMWKPSLPIHNVLEIKASIGGKTAVYRENTEEMLVVTKEIKNFLKRASLSAFVEQKTSEPKTKTYVKDAIEKGENVLEIKQTNSKYLKIAFKFEDKGGSQKITVFATRTNSYENAEVKVFNNCQLNKLIKMLRSTQNGN